MTGEGVGLDPTVAALAEPPLPPIDADDLTPVVLAALLRRVMERSVQLDLSRWFWGEGVVLDALIEASESLAEPVPNAVIEYFEGRDLDAIVIDHVNAVAPGAAAARLGRRNVGTRLLAWLRSSGATSLSPNGAVEHWPGGVWADTAYMLGTFLVRHGALTGDHALVEQAAEQWLRHAEVLQHPETGLMAHGSHRGEVPPCYWGRANAWLALAGCLVLEHRPSAPRACALRERLERQLAGVREFLPARGLWSVLIDGHPETRGIVETSGAAGLIAALFRAAALGVDSDANRACARDALCRLVPYIDDDGTLTATSAGTVLQLIPFGYSVIRNDRVQPWGQGLCLHALAAAFRDASQSVSPA